MFRHVVFTIAAALIALLATGEANADFIVYKVGAAPECPFHTIQEAVDAAAAHPGTDYVWIAMDQDYTDEHVIVTDQDVVIEGGFTDCFDNDPELDQTTISGTSGHSVFEIEGTSNVVLGNMIITGAVMNEDHSGGGIYFGGQGSLRLQTVWVFDNTAGYGGGIDVSPTGPTDVTLIGSVVSGNTALVSGGGIRVEGETTLTVAHSGDGVHFDFVTYNHALGQGNPGYGGGIEVIGPATANVWAVVEFNTATYGGGIAALVSENSDPVTVSLYATDVASPVEISSNAASATGGGIYLKGHADTLGGGVFASLHANTFRMENNVAQDGAAIYGDEDFSFLSGEYYGSVVELSGPSYNFAPCPSTNPCDLISGNVAEDSSGNPTDGAAILMQSNSHLSVSGVSFIGNRGGYLTRCFGEYGSESFLEVALMARNIVTHDLINFAPSDNHTLLHLLATTIVDNTIGSNYVIYADAEETDIRNTIIDQVGTQTIAHTGTLEAAYVLTNDTSTLRGGPFIQGEPLYVDRTGGDYHLQRRSLGVDFAPWANTPPLDLDGNPTPLDLFDVANEYGPSDLGAYEIQDQANGLLCSAPDTVCCGDFEQVIP